MSKLSEMLNARYERECTDDWGEALKVSAWLQQCKAIRNSRRLHHGQSVLQMPPRSPMPPVARELNDLVQPEREQK